MGLACRKMTSIGVALALIASLIPAAISAGCADSATSQNDPDAVQVPPSYSRTVSNDEIARYGGGDPIGITRNMTAYHLRVDSPDASARKLTGRDFGTIAFNMDGCVIRPDQSADSVLSGAISRNGHKAVPVDLLLDGKPIAHTWAVIPDDVGGLDIEYQGSDAGPVYDLLKSPYRK